MPTAQITAQSVKDSLVCHFEYKEEEPFEIHAKIDGFFELRGIYTDLFEGLLEIRRRLESQGIRLLCAGAQRNVFPSGMARQMSGGLIAYRLSIGKPAQRSDIVKIFDVVEDQLVGTVKEQLDFFQQWSNSISQR